MATRDVTERATGQRYDGMQEPGYGRRQGQRPLFGGYEETKPSFLTTELWAAVAAITGIAIAVGVLDNFDAPEGWRLIAAVAIGYILSRGIAKAGTRHHHHD
jgi:hypothetical protein